MDRAPVPALPPTGIPVPEACPTARPAVGGAIEVAPPPLVPNTLGMAWGIALTASGMACGIPTVDLVASADTPGGGGI